MRSLAVASSSFAAGIARRSARVFASSLAANLAPDSSASESGTGGRVPISEPLSPMAPAIRSFDNGDAIWALTEIDPADSPAIVTLSGSPPNAAMFRLTQPSAACWSSRP